MIKRIKETASVEVLQERRKVVSRFAAVVQPEMCERRRKMINPTLIIGYDQMG